MRFSWRERWLIRWATSCRLHRNKGRAKRHHRCRDFATSRGTMRAITSHTLFTLAVLLGINTMNFFDRQILPAVQEKIRTEWGLSDTALGDLGTAFILLYAAVGLPLGRLADVWRRKLL